MARVLGFLRRLDCADGVINSLSASTPFACICMQLRWSVLWHDEAWQSCGFKAIERSYTTTGLKAHGGIRYIRYCFGELILLA